MKMEYIFATLLTLESVAFAIMSAASGVELQPVSTATRSTVAKILIETLEIKFFKRLPWESQTIENENENEN